MIDPEAMEKAAKLKAIPAKLKLFRMTKIAEPVA
jgi:hypothetical protein